MSSGDQWPPVSYASAGKGSAKFNGSRKYLKDTQQETLKTLNEMFSTTVESEVILSVAQNCHWELQQSIEGLIELSETVESPPTWKNTSSKMEPMSSGVETTADPTGDSLPSMDENPSIFRGPQDAESVQKVELPKRGGTKNRMDSFCGNIAKLKTSTKNPDPRDSSFGKIHEDSSILPDYDSYGDGEDHLGARGNVRFLSQTPSLVSYGNFPESPISLSNSTGPMPREKKTGNDSKSRYNWTKRVVDPEKSRNFQDSDDRSRSQKVACFDSNVNVRKNESESLCGLKVQYRLSGMESSSDDDADVVIEDESSDYAINLTSAAAKNVSQFLSPSTETPPRHTRPEIHMINTPSPPRTPQRSVHDTTFARIKASVLRGDPIIVIIRGLPGSGKTTLAKSIISATIGENPSSYVYSTDDYFMNLGRGVYKFDPARLTDAHASNQSRVLRAMRDGRTPIIVDNTNVEAWEMRPYAAMAVQYGYVVEILEPNTPWARNPKELALRNTHNVPRAKIRERASKYENIANGQGLLDMYNLKYSSRNVTPEVTSTAKIRVETKRARVDSRMAGIESNWDNHDRNNYILTSHDIESMQNIDETHNPRSSEDTSHSEYTARKSTNIPSYADKVFNDYLNKLQDSDDESFEMLDSSGIDNLSDLGKTLDIVGSFDTQSGDNTKRTVIETKEDSLAQQTLGAIGSERKVSHVVIETKEESNAQPTLGAIGSERKVSHVVIETKEETNAQPTLGAIGSERKVSHAAAAANFESTRQSGESDNSGNVLSQCWDFTLIREGCKLHSEHGHYVSPFAAAKKADEGIDLPDNTQVEESTIETIIGKAPIDEKTGSDSEKEIVDDVAQVEAPNRGNLIDLNDDVALKIEVNPETILAGDKDIVEVDEKDQILDDPAISSIAGKEHLREDADVNAGKKVSESDANISGEKKPEVGGETRTALGTLFHVIKTSILGGFEESSTAENDDDENLEKFVSFEIEENESSNAPESATENVVNEKADEKNENEEISIDRAAGDSPEKVEETDENVSNDENSVLDKTGSTSEVSSTTTSSSLTDNVNSISWKESPFPVDGTMIPVACVLEDARVSKVDAETMTTPYDFNVAYVGGTSEPGYRELWGVSRSINDSTRIATIPKLSSKTTFDKSSMTGEIDILAAESTPSDKEKDSTNRLDDLIEMFPHYPREYLKTLYEQQCNCNFEWVVDVLCLADVPNLTIENYERKTGSPETSNDDESAANKFSKADDEKFKQRSHSSSPRNRRRRAKDFRSFSLDCVQDFTDCEESNVNEEYDGKSDDENKILEQFYAQALCENNLPGERNETAISSVTSGPSIETNLADNDEILELDFGREFINRLENTCGNPDFVLPDEFKPVLRMKKSMVEELYGMWIQSMNDQMNVLHAQLDERMAQDEAMARAMDLEESIQAKEEPVVPNLDEIMSMEMALAKYQNELKEIVSRETPNDMASRLTRQMLYDLLPDIDKQVLSDVLKAHGGNFKETCEIIEANIGRTINRSDTLRQQQSLLERVNEERKNRDVEENSEIPGGPLIVVNPDISTSEKLEKTHYEDAIRRGQDARIEAQRQVSLRIENYNKAAEAYRKGQPQVAAYYSQMVKLHSENIKAAHANAASEFLAAQMYNSYRDDTLDLHYLHVREALQALDVFLDFQQKKLNKSNRRIANLFIITGHGARSSNGLGRIKPAVSKRLISKNIRFTEANLGCLKVSLNRRNGAFD